MGCDQLMRLYYPKLTFIKPLPNYLVKIVNSISCLDSPSHNCSFHDSLKVGDFHVLCVHFWDNFATISPYLFP